MNPLSMTYGGAVWLRNSAWDRGLLPVRRLSWPVVSVGNLSVGGSGKTPFVMALGKLLRERGFFVTVLSRGYRRHPTQVEIVDPAGTPQRYGDEPLLIAQKLGAPVIVGADRFQGGLLADRMFSQHSGQGIHILDDGFQHRRLARDFDIVLLPADDLHGKLLPVGRLREPVASLRRCDAIGVFDQATAEALPYSIREKVFMLDRSFRIPSPPKQPVLAFCGIARPQRFFDDLHRAEIAVAAKIAFRDHHRYARADVDRLLRLQKESRAECLVTTEKDRINLGPLAHLAEPLTIAEIDLRISQPQALLTGILGRIDRHRASVSPAR